MPDENAGCGNLIWQVIWSDKSLEIINYNKIIINAILILSSYRDYFKEKKIFWE